MDFEKLEQKFKEITQDVVEKQFGTIDTKINGLIDEKITKMFESVTLEKLMKNSSKGGVSLAAKKDFAAKLKALSEGTNSAGGFLVPDEIQAGIARIVEDYGLVRKFATKFTMNSDTLNLPRLSTTITVGWPSENTAGTASDIVLANVQLLAKTAVGLTVMSNELLRDANISVTDYLITLFAEAFAGEEDNQGLVGSGSPFTGVLNDAGVNLVTPATGNSTFTLCTTADNLRDMVSNVKPTALSGAAYIMHRSVFAIAQKQKDTAGNYIVTSPTPVIYGMGAESPVLMPAGYIWQYPVYLSEKMPSSTAVSTKYIIFGNLKYVAFGDRQNMEASMSDAAVIGGSSAFEKNQRVLRVTESIAIAVLLPSAFAVLRTSAT